MSAPQQDSLIFGKKELNFDEKWAVVDWTDMDSIVTLFPRYMQETYALQKSKAKNVSKTVSIEGYTMKVPFSDVVLLKDVDIQLEANRRTCLYGANSTGKTLLFYNMASGTIKGFPKHVHVHHMKELEGDELNDTVLNTVVNSHPFRFPLVKIEAKLKELLAAESFPSEDHKLALKTNLEQVQGHMRSIQGYDMEDRVMKMLRVLGFDETGMAKPVTALSGGLRMRVALAMAFTIDADFLLLDEPTNHLDFPSVLWLENRLRAYRGAFLMVSHDRELLNNVCTSVLLLEHQALKPYIMGFKEFEKKKGQEDKKTADDIDKFLQKNHNVDPSTMLGRQKADKQAWRDNYQRKLIAMAGKFTFPMATALSNPENLAPEQISLMRLDDLTFSYNVETGHYIFKTPISFNCIASTRVGVLGPNGAGKSTFLKLLTKKLIATTGSVTHHPSFTLAYFGQHSTAELDLETTALEFMQNSFPKESSGSLRNHLAKTGIIGHAADTRMKALSYSQRACIVFSKLTFICPHLLIMDEPTNFLDLESVDSLISACNKYKGALMLVSHNRDFLRKCAKQFLSIVPGQFALFDDLKTAERATYTFIEEMEAGGKVGADALAKNPGGGTVHSSQKVGGDKTSEQKEDGVKTISAGMKAITVTVAKPGAAGAAAPLTAAYAVNEKVQARWTDGKWYTAIVKKVDGEKFTILYTDYGNTVTVTAQHIRKAEEKKAAPQQQQAGARPQTAKAGARK